MTYFAVRIALPALMALASSCLLPFLPRVFAICFAATRGPELRLPSARSKTNFDRHMEMLLLYRSLLPLVLILSYYRLTTGAAFRTFRYLSASQEKTKYGQKKKKVLVFFNRKTIRPQCVICEDNFNVQSCHNSRV